MLEGAPTFAQIADEIEELLDDAVFVAHNVSFDYSFIKAEFNAIGRPWHPSRVCTIRLARKAFPGLPSYGLGNVCNWLDITNENAHRALSDARATAILFEKSLAILEEDVVKKMIAKASGEVFLPPNLDKKEYTKVPEAPGVYYLLNEKGKPIYIGKAKNLKKRVKQHFTVQPESQRMQAFMKEIHHVSFELTGTELIALLLEDAEIRKHWPPYNSAQKRKAPKVHIVKYTDQSGLLRLATQSSHKIMSSHKSFSSHHSAKNWLMELAKEFDIDMRLLGLDMFDVNSTKEEKDVHNNKLFLALETLSSREPSFIIQAMGRDDDEYSYVVVKSGVLMGYCFLPPHVNDLDSIEFALKTLQPTEVNASIISNINPNYRGYKSLHPVSLDA